jgi:hypothetical protein
MTYSYKILAPGLHETADAAINWFIEKWGLQQSRITIETPFDPDINFRPTFVAALADGHILCIEVAGNIYSNTLDSVVLDCLAKGLPVKLVVASPKSKDPDYSTKLKSAKRAGVGVFEVDSQSGLMIQVPLSLSLAGLRSLELKDFPKRYRQPLQHAHQMFRDGEPSKACSLVYDELEGACRNLGKRCIKKGLWSSKGLKVESDAWATVMRSLDQGLNRSDPHAKKITSALIARIIGITSHRNESGHKPKNLRERSRRDQELRTRFEGGVDLLKDLLNASRGFGPI